MANRFWVGGTAAWDGTAGTKWAATSGGAGGQSVPTAADDVFFDAASGAVTVTVSASANCLSLNCTGFTGTITGTSTINVYANTTLASGMTWSHSGNFVFQATSGSYTVTSAGKTFGAGLIFGVLGASTATWTLQDALTLVGGITHTSGTFTTNNHNVTAASLSSNNGNTRTINLGSSTVTLSATSGTINFNNNAGLTFNAGTSTIACSGAGSNITTGSTGGSGSGVTFYNLSYTSTSVSTHALLSINTFNNLTVAAPASAGVTQVTFDSRQTINGTLSTTGTAGNRRVWFRGTTYGLAQTLTINSAPSLTDADFRDIYVIGTAAPISGTRVGNLRGCRGITFSTPKTVYWNLAAGGNWSANAWAATSGGGVSTDNFPLAQDTAVIENTGLNTSATVTLDSAITYIGSFNMSTRTNAMTFSASVNPTFYGNLTLGSGVTYNANLGTMTLSGRNTQTITSAGKTLGDITVDSYGGVLELADALNIGSRTLTVTNGTFDTKNYNVTAGSFASSNSNVRTINLGSSTVTLSSASGTTFSTTTNLTFNAGTSSIVFTTSSTGTILNGGGLTFYDVSFTSTSTATSATIAGTNTYRNLTFTAPASAGLPQYLFNANQTITGTLTCAGATAVRRIFLRSDTLGTQRDLTVGTLVATDCDFRDIDILGAAAGSSPTRAGDCGGNLGITFPAPKTVYWNLGGTVNWSATGWATGSGGTPNINNFPLAQDTAVFDNAGSAGIVSFDTAWNFGTLNASARTTAMTLNASSPSPVCYGNWTIGTGVTQGPNNTITFSGRGTSTVTSNGVAFNCNLTVDCVTGTVQLADALTINTARSLTLTSGTFDAVTYNVTTGGFSNTPATGTTLRMGSGTWTLSSTGPVWNCSANTIFKGTANIVLSDTSTTARIFAGNGLSYNKLTIGGTTGTSTTTITGNNQFTELASTKTVAHTIALGTTTQTFGAWTVSGTVGNVVTVSGTGVITIAGAAVSGVDYLALGTTTVSATSPGEFYAGANSTATSAAAPLYLTAKPADSTRYWVGGTGNWSDTARWSTSSGGGSGASVPRSHDDVVFDSASNATAYTATVNAVTGGIRCKALTIAGPLSGNLTLAGSTAIDGIHGNVSLAATGITRTYTGAITLSGSATGRTLTTNSVTLGSSITVNGFGCGWSLGSALSMGSSGNLGLRAGSFNTANFNLTCTELNILTFNTVSISLGSSTVSLSGSSPIGFGTTEDFRANFTFTAGTSQLNFTSLTSTTINGNNNTFYNVSATTTDFTTFTVRGINTFNNLTIAGRTSAGVSVVSFEANQTINGTLTLSAGTNATMRTFVQSNTLGTTRTLTCAAVASLTDIDFRDITIAGAAAPVSGTRLGDCKGNSGITFDAAKTVYYRNTAGNWGATTWSFTNNGTADVTAFPLAQDTAVFPSSPVPYPSSGATCTSTVSYNIGTIDMSARTSNTMTLALSTSTPTIYGNWINGTGTTLTGTGTLTFAGRGSQTITSAGVAFPQNVTIDSPSGTVTLQDAINISTLLFRFNNGTFNTANYAVTAAAIQVLTTTAKQFSLGSSTITLTTSGTVWSVASPTNFTITGTGTFRINNAAAKTFAGGGISYSGITLDQGGAGTLTITGNNTFANITNTYKATGATNITLGTTTQRVGNFTASGEAGRVLTVQGTSASNPATLIYTGTGQAAQPAIDYLAITGVRAYSLDTTWYAGANSTNNGSLGWYFEAAPGGVITVFIIENATANSTEASLVTFNASASELAAGSDAVLGGLTYLGTLSESATAADVDEAVVLILRAINESASAQDINSVVASAFNAAVAEIANSLDTTQSTASLFAAASESATALDTIASFGSLTGQVVELAVGLDEALVLASTFSAAASESAQAQDLFAAPGSIYSAATVEIAVSSDSIVGAYLWNPIDDTQNPNWQNINNAQSVTWTTVPDTQTPGWVIIPTSND